MPCTGTVPLETFNLTLSSTALALSHSVVSESYWDTEIIRLITLQETWTLHQYVALLQLLESRSQKKYKSFLVHGDMGPRLWIQQFGLV